MLGSGTAEKQARNKSYKDNLWRYFYDKRIRKMYASFRGV